MKTDSKHKYYSDEDEINFEKLNNFRKFNSNFKNTKKRKRIKIVNFDDESNNKNNNKIKVKNF